MSPETQQPRRILVWSALFFSAITFAVSWWRWWTFQYGTFDLAFYVQALWLALRGKWMVSLLNVPLMGNHAEPIVFLLTPLFAICPHPMLFVAVQTLAFATMPFTAYRIGKHLNLEPRAALLMALATIVTPAAFSIGVYEFHPEALSAPLLLLLIEARLAERYGRYWLWFLAVLGVKENMAPLLMMFGGVLAVVEWKRPRRWQLLWNVVPAVVAMAWLAVYGKVISPALNAGNVDYLQLYGHLGSTPPEIIRNFFVEPKPGAQAVKVALTQGNMLPSLLLPMLLLPLFRPRWLLIASPLLAQHLLSYRYSEWSIGAHYPAPFLPLFWVAAAEVLRRLRSQTAIAAAVLAACALAHLRFGEARGVVAEIPRLGSELEEREWKAAMIADIPADASVTASLGFVPHLAAREHLISLHHILKGLKTLSVAAYAAPPPGDVVVIDYGDGQTFNAVAGYYHPWSRTDETHFVPSSDRLLHDYLAQATWHPTSRNSLTILRRGQPLLRLEAGFRRNAQPAAAFQVRRPHRADGHPSFPASARCDPGASRLGVLRRAEKISEADARGIRWRPPVSFHQGPLRHRGVRREIFRGLDLRVPVVDEAGTLCLFRGILRRRGRRVGQSCRRRRPSSAQDAARRFFVHGAADQSRQRRGSARRLYPGEAGCRGRYEPCAALTARVRAFWSAALASALRPSFSRMPASAVYWRG